MKRRLLLNSLSGSVLAAAYSAVAFIMAPVIVRSLGNQNYGIWDVLQSLVGYLGVLDLGISPAVVRYVALAKGRGDTREADRVVSSALVLLGGFGLIGFGCMALLSLAPELVLNVPSGSGSGLPIVCFLVGANILLEFPGAALVGYLFGTQQHYFLNSIRLTNMLLSAATIYTALTHAPGNGLVWMALINFGFNLVQYFILALRVLRGRGGARFSFAHFSWPLARELYRFGAKSVTLLFASRLRRQSIPIVIAHTAGLDRVVYFAIPNRLIESGWSLGTALGAPLTPHLSHLHGAGDRDATRRAWLGAARGLQFCLLGLAVGMLGLGRPFMARWMGEEYAAAGSWALGLLATGALFEGYAAGSGSLLVSRGRHGPLAKFALVVSLTSILISIPATQAVGVAGAAGAVTFGAAVLALRSVRSACQEIGITMMDHFRATTLRLVLPLVAMAGVLTTARLVLNLDSYPVILASALFASCVYTALAVAWALDRDEREEVVGRVSQLFRRADRAAKSGSLVEQRPGRPEATEKEGD
ncbi:MAG: lipopolysaccharide biosynthesis protein [Acidobacteria bacterium]|jgi:O-antigen/teichoic acid export membrane protein|nr:lipopolysaccharide biosynthesis protein [Acidobacteriota bacterium]